MRISLRYLLLVLFASMCSGVLLQVHAQTVTQRQVVAFVNSDRTAIFIKQPDSALQVLFQTTPDLQATNLAVLGANPAGTNFLIGGNFTYTDPSSSVSTTYTGIVAIPKNLSSNPLQALTQIKFLKRATVVTVSSFRPLGALTADGNEWYATMLSSTSGSIPLFFYHGRMDKNETDAGYTIDSVGLGTNTALEGDYHLSNLSVTPDGKLLCTSVDHLTDDQRTRFQLYVWHIHDIPATLSVIDYSSRVKGLGLRANPDSNFAFTILATSNTHADLGLANVGSNSDNTIQYFDTPIDGSNVDLTHPSRSIQRSAIPSDMNFFSGNRGTLPNGKSYNEVDPYAAQYGAPGDVNYSASGDSAVFVTHEAPDNISQRFKKSAVFVYDFNTGTATQVYNDTNALELQPVFIPMPFVVPQPEGTLSVNVASLNFGVVDTGTTTAAKAVKLTNGGASNAKAITIDSVVLAGNNTSNFTWTGATLPTSIAVADAGVTLNFTYTPTAPAATQTAVARVYWNGGATSTNITMSGTSKVKTGGGGSVAQNDVHASIGLSPNPFTRMLTVGITAEEAGRVEIRLFDLLGHDRFSTERMIARGAVEHFSIDATSLGLSSGTYYVSVSLNGRTSVKQVVLQ